MAFPIRALQVGGGPEFAAEFEQACQQRELRLFVLPPRSPKLNGSVERAQRSHTEEFYQVGWFSPTCPVTAMPRFRAKSWASGPASSSLISPNDPTSGAGREDVWQQIQSATGLSSSQP